ncbi:hypothetical protein F7725_016538 [Dissostichus mawsoni]|uniref:Prokineticin domain-containing protein n=1 Tax=Dissostichus mawsoni TaxID=36200 RepID=A0A7J5Z1W6_DISMA|nr:hypothetical protein F7725_016538 [Dissostichus mawsoni]
MVFGARSSSCCTALRMLSILRIRATSEPLLGFDGIWLVAICREHKMVLGNHLVQELHANPSEGRWEVGHHVEESFAILYEEGIIGVRYVFVPVLQQMKQRSQMKATLGPGLCPDANNHNSVRASNQAIEFVGNVAQLADRDRGVAERGGVAAYHPTQPWFRVPVPFPAAMVPAQVPVPAAMVPAPVPAPAAMVPASEPDLTAMFPDPEPAQAAMFPAPEPAHTAMIQASVRSPQPWFRLQNRPISHGPCSRTGPYSHGSGSRTGPYSHGSGSRTGPYSHGPGLCSGSGEDGCLDSGAGVGESPWDVTILLKMSVPYKGCELCQPTHHPPHHCHSNTWGSVSSAPGGRTGLICVTWRFAVSALQGYIFRSISHATPTPPRRYLGGRQDDASKVVSVTVLSCDEVLMGQGATSLERIDSNTLITIIRSTVASEMGFIVEKSIECGFEKDVFKTVALGSKKACEKDSQCGGGMCCAMSLWIRGLRMCTTMGQEGDECHPMSHKAGGETGSEAHPELLVEQEADGVGPRLGEAHPHRSAQVELRHRSSAHKYSQVPTSNTGGNAMATESVHTMQITAAHRVTLTQNSRKATWKQKSTDMKATSLQQSVLYGQADPPLIDAMTKGKQTAERTTSARHRSSRKK